MHFATITPESRPYLLIEVGWTVKPFHDEETDDVIEVLTPHDPGFGYTVDELLDLTVEEFSDLIEIYIN